jgi:hypothetical protein
VPSDGLAAGEVGTGLRDACERGADLQRLTTIPVGPRFGLADVHAGWRGSQLDGGSAEGVKNRSEFPHDAREENRQSWAILAIESTKNTVQPSKFNTGYAVIQPGKQIPLS